jgi:heme exporter protein A
MEAQLRQQPQGSSAGSAVQAVALSKSIGGRPILRDVSFEIDAGSFLSLLGPNGAGKSTLLSLLASLSTPTSGSISIFGHAARHTEAHARSRIGVIGHNTMLYRDLSPLENLMFFGSLYAIDDPARRASEVLELVGLARRSRDQVKTLSRGMTQRVAIARALMHDPDLLLADEPFAGLDVPSARILSTILTDLHLAGKTIILATHDVHQSLSLTERVLVLRAGRLIIDEHTASLDEEFITDELVKS